MDVKTKREREKETVSRMIAIYCRKNHGGENALSGVRGFGYLCPAAQR